MRFSAKFIYLCFFVLFFLSLVFNVKITNAQLPPPRVSCDDTKDGEFNYLRPYQASPCGDSSKARFCGNKIIMYEEREHTYTGGPEVCNITEHPINEIVNKTYIVQMEDMELPILGNTELTKNVTNAEDQIDDAQKLNEYVSWYLSGVNNKSQYGSEKNDPDTLVNFSGPVNKLLSWFSLAEERIDTVNALGREAQNPLDQTVGNTTPEQERHDQVVVCAQKEFSILGLVRVGKFVAVPCPGGPDTEELRISAWVDHLPPLPSDEKYKNNEEQYKKDLCEWKGGVFWKIPFTEITGCTENPANPNKWADLFAYIPISSTDDNKSKQPTMNVHVAPIKDTVISPEKPDYAILNDEALHFSHTAEDSELSEILNKTFIPIEGAEQVIDYESVESDIDNDTGQCRLIDIRSNPGDDLFPELKNNEYEWRVEPYTIETIPCSGQCKVEVVYPSKKDLQLDPNAEPVEVYSKDCYGGVSITSPTLTKVPFATEIFANTTAGAASTFRKIFPRVEEGAPVSCIANIPTVTNATYLGFSKQTGSFGSGSSQEIQVEEPTGERSDPATEVEANFFLPYFGSVYEYFLKGIQTALRPKGYGEPITSGRDCGGPECGVLPEAITGSVGSCSLGSISPKISDIPNNLRWIIESAAETYNTPPDLILAVMYGEGLFEPGRLEWTEQNVANWATCQPVPGCNETGDDNFMGFNGNTFYTIADIIAPDLAALDPERFAPSQCNLLDSIYAMAYDLHNNADGGSQLPPTCFGINLRGNVPQSCTGWSNENYASAIKVHENGYEQTCFTREGGCLLGTSLLSDGSVAAECPDADTCETVSNYNQSNPSHFACLWEVAHGK